jgi:hypothetical protein
MQELLDLVYLYAVLLIAVQAIVGIAVIVGSVFFLRFFIKTWREMDR